MPNTALPVIDIQRAAFDGVRCPPMDSPDQLLENAHTLIDAALASRNVGELVVRGLRSQHCVSNTTHSALSGQSPAPSEAARAELAPGGTLLAGMNLSNALFTARDAATGELRGVSVDLMRELASSLGVPVEFVLFETPGDVADAAESGTWDVAILAIEPARAEKIAFSPPITEIEATYAVHADSALGSAAEADAAGVRIAAQKKAGYELFLARTLKHATLVHTKSFSESIEVFNERRADALSGLKPALLESMDKLPDARLLDGTFMTVNHGLGTPRRRSAGAAYLESFVTAINAAGFVARSIARHGIQGLSAVK